MCTEDAVTIFDELIELNPEALLADGFEAAYLGYVSHGIAVYSREKCLEILMERDGMSADDAEEFFSFNTEGAYVGPFTPLFLNTFRPEIAAMFGEPTADS